MKTFLINSSLLKEADCQYKVDLIHNKGLYQTEDTFKMDYGSALHKALKLFYQGMSETDATIEALTYYTTKCSLQIPSNEWRTTEHLAKVIKAYFSYYRQDSFQCIRNQEGKAGVELSFALPYEKETLYDPKTLLRVEILLVGTIDAMGSQLGYGTCIMDHKVTSNRFANSFLDGYELDHQMMFYSYCYRKWSQMYLQKDPGYLPAIVDGVFIKNHKGVRGPWDGVSFQRSSPIQFSEERMNEFETMLHEKIMAIINSNEHSTRNFLQCKAGFGCRFAEGCRLDSTYRMEYFKNHFGVREYNPLKQQD